MREELVREYVRSILMKEEDYGYGDYSYGDMGGGFGWDPGSDAFSKAFVTPFTDILNTARAEGSKILSNAQTLMAYIIRSMAVSLVPFVKDDYEDIDEKAAERMEKIKSKYADVYKRTDDAFKEDDFKLALFLWRPHQYLASSQAFAGPNAALKALDVISGGNEYVTRFTDSAREKIDALTFTESVERLTEAPETDRIMKKVMAMPDIQRALKKSPVVRKMRDDGKRLVSHHVQDVVSHAHRMIQKVSSPEALMQMGKMDKRALDAYSKLDGQEKEAAAQKITSHAKKMTKGFYLMRLKSEAENFKSAADLHQIFQSGISAIQGM